MASRQATIGLEVHVELKTATKMFCDCPNDPDERKPNVNTCPVCLGHPGALPAANAAAIEHVIRVGLALGGRIPVISKFDRKNYFYPDLPKGYQITQYDQPFVEGGELCGIRIRRVHLEEDVGKLAHALGGVSLVDYNRSSVPLMELVTEPDIRSAEQAVEFAKALQRLLRYLGASDADMERGQMRVEANVSLDMGTKVELKNINSFRTVLDAVNFEIKRHGEALDNGTPLRQETRGWDENKRVTFHQRFKEDAHDYRYFPEPDIPPLDLSKLFDLEDMRRHLPELPDAKRERFEREFSLEPSRAETLTSDPAVANYFEAAVSELAARDDAETAEVLPRLRNSLFAYLTSDLRGLMNETGVAFSDIKVKPEHLAHLVDLVDEGKIGSRQAKDILRIMFGTGDDPEDILDREGLHTISDEGALEATIATIIQANPAAVDDYKKGKITIIQFLIGQAMKELKGRGNPAQLKELFERKLAQ